VSSDTSTVGPTARPAYARAPEPCSAVAPALSRRLGLRSPTSRVYEQFELDESEPNRPLVSYDDVSCEWTVPNPGRGADGRANEMTASVSYAVIEPTRPSAGAIAAAVLAHKRERLGKGNGIEVVGESSTLVDGYDGYYVYAHRKSATGTGAEVEGAVRVANAVVAVQFSGADLRFDRSKPAGLGLMTEPVDEKRLRPTVSALLPAAVKLLTEGGGR
jgi:hypothetical protein